MFLSGVKCPHLLPKQKEPRQAASCLTCSFPGSQAPISNFTRISRQTGPGYSRNKSLKFFLRNLAVKGLLTTGVFSPRPEPDPSKEKSWILCQFEN